MNENLINQLSERLNWTPAKISETLGVAMRLMNEELPENTQISIPATGERDTSVVSYEKKTSRKFVSELTQPLQWTRDQVSDVLRTAFDMMNEKTSEDMEMFVPVRNEDPATPLRFEKRTNKDLQEEIRQLMDSTHAKISDALDLAVTAMYEQYPDDLEVFVPIRQQVPEPAHRELVIKFLPHQETAQQQPETDSYSDTAETTVAEQPTPADRIEDELPQQEEPEPAHDVVFVSEPKKDRLTTDDIVAGLSHPLNWEQSKTSSILDAVVDIINEKLAENAQIFIPDFGVFQTQKKIEHIAVDSGTHQRYLVPPKIVATFKPVSGVRN